MPLQREIKETVDWREDASEMEFMTDDEFETEDLLDDEPDEISDEISEETACKPGGSAPVWRLIEMSQENRFLSRELADFEDYDFFDSSGDSGADNYVH